MINRFANDGSDLNGWVSSGSVVVTASDGNPSPCISMTGGSYSHAYTGMIPGDTIETDFMLKGAAGQTNLADLLFFCSATGANGAMVRFDQRSGQKCGFGSSGTWSSIGSLYGSGIVYSFSTQVWHRAKVQTRRNGYGADARLYIDDTLVVDWTAVPVGGSYIGLHGDAISASGVNWDNLAIGADAKISGTAKLDNGAPADIVRINQWSDGMLVTSVAPGADGSFVALVPSNQYQVTVIGPAGYQPITHGPIDAIAAA